MLLLWNVRYLDRTDKQFKTRYLHLDTTMLDAVSRATIEFVAENHSAKTERGILSFRHLFTEGTVDDLPGDSAASGRFIPVGPSEYFEDETGHEITDDEMARILTGSPTARAIPPGAKRYDVELMLAVPTPLPLAEVSLTTEEIRLLGYFARDLQEMLTSAFLRTGPGSLHTSGGFTGLHSKPTLRTAATDDEIRSFVMIFRRLYMQGTNDPASFVKIIPIITKVLGDHPYGKWIAGAAEDYKNHLESVPDLRPIVASGTCTFTTKLLIDVFLYTQYAHQPEERRQRQFGECLSQVQGKRDLLTWMFLTEMSRCAGKIGRVGKVIAEWFQHYCDHHVITPDVLRSLRDVHSGIGTVEKDEDRRERLFNEKAAQLAAALWEQADRPAGGPSQFLADARDQLRRRV